MRLHDIKLHKLVLDSNDLSKQTSQFNHTITDFLCKARIKVLSLGDCKLEPSTVLAIGNGLASNQHLESLSLRGNTLQCPWFLEFC